MPGIKPDARRTVDSRSRALEQGQRLGIAPDLHADLGENSVGLALDIGERLRPGQFVCRDAEMRLVYRLERGTVADPLAVHATMTAFE